jgi:hypothetical protein
MRVVDMEYDQYIETAYPLKQKIRDLGDCTIWRATGDCTIMAGDRLTIILEDPVHRRVTLFEYDSFAEINKDIEVVMNIGRDDGDAASGVPAWLKPPPPTRSAGFAQPVPARGGD